MNIDIVEEINICICVYIYVYAPLYIYIHMHIRTNCREKFWGVPKLGTSHYAMRLHLLLLLLMLVWNKRGRFLVMIIICHGNYIGTNDCWDTSPAFPLNPKPPKP